LNPGFPQGVVKLDDSSYFHAIAFLLDDSKLERREKGKEEKGPKKYLVWDQNKVLHQTRASRTRNRLSFFNYTDASRKLDPYLEMFFCLNQSEARIKKIAMSGKGHLLHGPYERIINEVVVEVACIIMAPSINTWNAPF